MDWNPHVEQLQDAGFPRPREIYEALIETPDSLGRSVGRLVDICCEAMAKAKQQFEREAYFYGHAKTELVLPVGATVLRAPQAPSALELLAHSHAPPRDIARPRSKRAQRARDRRWG